LSTYYPKEMIKEYGIFLTTNPSKTKARSIMSTLRSERAKRRAAKIRNTRIVILSIVLLVVATGAYIIYSTQTNKPTENQVETMITTDSGLKYVDLVVGNGQVANPGSQVSVHYSGWLEDGTKFDSSLDRGQPFDFVLGAGSVIPGWDEGVAGMKVGGKRRLVIPSDLAYGPQGYAGVIPPNATLTFEVELLGIQ
jgi:hypothetical protein